MARITTTAAGIGACAALLCGLAAGAPAAAATRAAGWTRYHPPVTGQANLDAVAAPGRAGAWAGGFTIHNSSASAGQRAARRESAGGIPCPFTGFLDSLMLH